MIQGHSHYRLHDRSQSFVVAFTFITFRVSRRPREMYCGHARLCVCLSVRGRMPTLSHAGTRM